MGVGRQEGRDIMWLDDTNEGETRNSMHLKTRKNPTKIRTR